MKIISLFEKYFIYSSEGNVIPACPISAYNSGIFTLPRGFERLKKSSTFFAIFHFLF